MKKILFVCLGNICRSPLAEGIFRSLVEKENLSKDFTIESRGTGAWHIGSKADKRTRERALEAGYDLGSHRARQVNVRDLEMFDLILAMDSQNLFELQNIAPPGTEKKLRLFREFDPENPGKDLTVPDPYYGGNNGFQIVQDIVERTCKKLLQELTLRGV